MLRNTRRPAILGLLLIAATVLGACAPSVAAPLATSAVGTAVAAAPTVGAAVATSAAAVLPTAQAILPTAQAEVPTAEAALPTAEAAVPTAEAAVPTLAAALTATAAPMGSATATMMTPAATAAAVPGATGTAHGPAVQIGNNATLGQILVNSAGMTLYIFKNDTPGVSACTGGCATIWPPLTVAQGTTPTAAPGITGTLGTIQRADGTTQVTYNEMPLYLYAADQAPGDARGQGLQNLWYVVSVGPAGAATPVATAGY